MLLKVAGAPLFLTHTNGTTPTTVSCTAGLVYGVEDWNESDIAMSAVTGGSKVNGALGAPPGSVGVVLTSHPAVMGGLAAGFGTGPCVTTVNTPPTEPDQAVLMITGTLPAAAVVVPVMMASVAPVKLAPV